MSDAVRARSISGKIGFGALAATSALLFQTRTAALWSGREGVDDVGDPHETYEQARPERGWEAACPCGELVAEHEGSAIFSLLRQRCPGSAPSRFAGYVSAGFPAQCEALSRRFPATRIKSDS